MSTSRKIKVLHLEPTDVCQARCPLCEIGNKGLYIDARGRLFPCCWVANRYNHNNEWQILAQKFDLNKRDLTLVLHDEFWQREFRQFRWQECQTKCSSAIVNQDYATQW